MNRFRCNCRFMVPCSLLRGDWRPLHSATLRQIRVPGLAPRDEVIAASGFAVEPEATGRPGYHPATMLKIYLYGYINQIQSSRRLERECERNIELMWLTGQLTPDFKTIADFRRDNGPAIRKVCARFI